jgi:hypothetical protein
MEPNPMLEEIWRIKAGLAREACSNLHPMFQQTRQWVAGQFHPGSVVHGGGESKPTYA